MNKSLLLVCLFLLLASVLYAEESIYVKFRLEVPRTCKFGDYDAIRQDMMWSTKPKLIISLVDISTGLEYSQELLSELNSIKNHQALKRFMDKFIAGEYSFLVKVPKLDRRYMVVLCKDSADTGKCLDKKLRSINNILGDYVNPKADFRSEDNIYFYRPVNIKNAVATMDDGNDLPASYRHAVDIMKSLPIEKHSVGDTLIIKLPYFDSEKCGQNF